MGHHFQTCYLLFCDSCIIISCYLPHVECEEHSDLEQIDEQVGFSEDRIDSDGHHNQTRNGYTWGINMENIDPSVLDELPMEIQREIREWFHPPKRANTSRKGSTIVHYFSPVKKG